ncbi:MAG: enoyl-CoA hydratase/isomerase family protein [Rhodospirillales bacterium]|nr:enoyl-CoA hydratase/isomerase family protein [Rhodospirillales bacterium]
MQDATGEAAIRVEYGAGFRRLILNRPDKLNALNRPMLAALIAALDEAGADPACRAVILTGAGRGFCAGQELGPEVMPGAAGPADLGQLADRHHHAVVRRIRALPKPVIAAVNGVAAGAGASFALACDIVLAGHSARFVQAFARIGLVPDSGASFFLPRLIGDARARAAILLGEPVGAADALAWGMIWKMVEDDALHAEAEALAVRLAGQAGAALAASKRLLNQASGDLDGQLDRERDAQRLAGQGAEFAEGVRAFTERRPPRFPGSIGGD